MSWRLLERWTSLALVIFLVAAGPGRAADPFYEDLLRAGVEAAEAGDAARAAKLLRLACFGLLEEPNRLGRCLTHLALAQAELGDQESFRRTFRRIVEVERTFEGYSEARISIAHRRAFESRVAEWIDAEELRRTGVFRTLAPPEEEGATESSTAAPATPAVSDEIVSALTRARELQQSGSREDFARELERLRPLLRAYPEISELQHEAAALAYRLRLWRESRAYFERGGDVDPAKPAHLFYYAVVLFETGERERAAEVMRLCLPRLQRTPFIDDYAVKILGDSE